MEDKIKEMHSIVNKWWNMCILDGSYENQCKFEEELSQLITPQTEEKRDSKEVIPVERVKEAFKNFVEYCEFNDLNKLVDKRDSTGNWYDLRQLVEEWVEDNMQTNTSSEKEEHVKS